LRDELDERPDARGEHLAALHTGRPQAILELPAQVEQEIEFLPLIEKLHHQRVGHPPAAGQATLSAPSLHDLDDGVLELDPAPVNGQQYGPLGQVSAFRKRYPFGHRFRFSPILKGCRWRKGAPHSI